MTGDSSFFTWVLTTKRVNKALYFSEGKGMGKFRKYDKWDGAHGARGLVS